MGIGLINFIFIAHGYYVEEDALAIPTLIIIYYVALWILKSFKLVLWDENNNAKQISRVIKTR